MDADCPPLVVLDTNALMDWLVFRHPSCADWDRRFHHREAVWVASAAVRAEWDHVLSRGVGAAWSPDPEALVAAWRDHAHMVEPGVPPLTLPLCSDPDDQKFIALAVSAGARWLVSRDRALLKMRRRLQRLGVEVATPEGWSFRPASG